MVIAGPILRKTTVNRLVYWLVTSRAVKISLAITTLSGEKASTAVNLSNTTQTTYQVGEKAYIHLIDATFENNLPNKIAVDILSQGNDECEPESIIQSMSHLCYPKNNQLVVEIRPEINHIYHGSCRKPHHNSPDALVTLDNEILKQHEHNTDETLTRPSLLMMSGDQVYVDDVAGPYLQAIHQVIQLLGLYEERLPDESGLTVAEIVQSPHHYYQRAQLLPSVCADRGWLSKKIGFNKIPIFTSQSSNQHLITLQEMLAMYLLTWSQQLWHEVTFDEESIPAEYRIKFQQERRIIENFSQGLQQVERVVAQIPTYMIFDDHDVTDDWNLTRGWEQAIYNHDFSRRIIGNALIGYFLGQAWGNEPDDFDDDFHERVSQCFEEFKQGYQQNNTNNQKTTQHEKLVEFILDWGKWHYTIDTQPCVVVLDTRTHRWRSESNLNKPSGLMDWEALTELQQTVLDKNAVILVSAAPIFGVKFIEVVQRVFTFFGKALTVDAENWMAHPGSASVILNIFLHKRTPQHFTLLSGDVHYSFVFDVTIRRRDQSPEICQITASGIKNSFPNALLKLMNFLDRLFYAASSPLNIFTKRRRMHVKARRVNGKRGHRLVNESAIGRLSLDQQGKPDGIELITASGQTHEFTQVKKRAS